MAALCKKVGLRERLGGFGKRFENPRSSNFTPGPGYYSYENASSPTHSSAVFKSKTKRDGDSKGETGCYYNCAYGNIGSRARGGGNILFKFLSVENNRRPAFQSAAPRFGRRGNGLPGPCYYHPAKRNDLVKRKVLELINSSPKNSECQNKRPDAKHLAQCL